MADIFVSYTSSDRDWAFWIAGELEKLGHTPHIHEWEIKSGDDIYAWMESRHDAADHVLCVVSDDYLKAPYSTLERNAALWQAVASRPGFVLFVAVKPCRLPTLVDHYRRCELYGITDAVARERFRAFMQTRDASAPMAFPGQEFAVSNIPIRVPEHFLGRDDSLAAIETALSRYEGRVAITALHGLRGVGKTTLAAAYAERHRGSYRATWWIRAQTDSTMRADLAGLGVRLNWVAADEKEEPALNAVMERLRHEGNGLLLIYDNATDADALKPYLPRGGAARVLVTSNAHTWRGVAAPVEIRLWPQEIGADYLIARTGRDDERDAAASLSAALGGLPLAHEQAAAYCERLDMPFADYQQRFEAMPAKLLDDARHAPAAYHDGLTVAKTFALAIEKAAKLHPAAEPLIAHCALLAAEPIPLFVFSEGREKLGEPLASALADDGLIEAIAALRAFALVDREKILDERSTNSTDAIRLHRLVRQVAAMRLDDEAREKAKAAFVAVLSALYPEDLYQNTATWVRLRRLDALALDLVDRGAPPVGAEKETGRLLEGLGSYHHWGLADLAGACRLHEKGLALREKVLGAKDAETAGSLNNLGLVFKDLGDLWSARPLFERALAINEEMLEPDDANTAACINNLAAISSAQGDHTVARTLWERALAMTERSMGENHPQTIPIIYNLGSLFGDQGDLASARPLLERAVATADRALDPDNMETARCLNGLGSLLRRGGDIESARQLHERALAICERVLSRHHPLTGECEMGLALVLHEQGDLAGARALLERSIAGSEKVYGPVHHATLARMRNLAQVVLDQKDFASTQVLLERILAARENATQPDPILVSNSLTSLAFLFWQQEKRSEALPLLERSLAMRQAAVGPEHVDIVVELGNIGRILQEMGRLDESDALLTRAIALGEKLGAAASCQVACVKGCYARLLLSKGDPEQALVYASAALSAHEAEFGIGGWTDFSAPIVADVLDALSRAGGASEVRQKYRLDAPAAAANG